MNNYFIKKGYIHRKLNITIDENRKKNYWTNIRIKGSSLYQYDVYKYAKKLITLRNITSVIDVGCGSASKLQKLITPVCNNITGIDQNSIITFCRKKYGDGNIHFITDDFENSKLKNNPTADLIICSDVIEHVSSPNKLLNYLKKFTTKKSLIILSTPERDILRGINNYESPQKNHLREWNNSELIKYLESQNFKIIHNTLVHSLKFSFYHPFLIEFIKKIITKKLKSNQLLLLKVKQ